MRKTTNWHRGSRTTYSLLEQSKICKDHQALDPTHNITAQDGGPPASHRLATVHPFTVTQCEPCRSEQGKQLGQGELFYQGELLVIPLYTSTISYNDKSNNGIANPLTQILHLNLYKLQIAF